MNLNRFSPGLPEKGSGYTDTSFTGLDNEYKHFSLSTTVSSSIFPRTKPVIFFISFSKLSTFSFFSSKSTFIKSFLSLVFAFFIVSSLFSHRFESINFSLISSSFNSFTFPIFERMLLSSSTFSEISSISIFAFSTFIDFSLSSFSFSAFDSGCDSIRVFTLSPTFFSLSRTSFLRLSFLSFKCWIRALSS